MQQSPDMSFTPQPQRPANPALWLLRVIQGALIGGGAILPGISGGVLSVIFGVYRPMMEFLSHPLRTFKKNAALFIPIIIGVVIGFWGFAKLLGLLFAKDSPYPISLFVGLILGTVPMLFKSAGKQGRGKQEWLALWATFSGLLLILIVLESVTKMDIGLNILTSFASGIIWGFSLVVPGLSSSSILLFFGVYKKIMAAVGNMELAVIIPLILGIVLVAFLFARLINRLFERRYGVASHAIVGLVLASTLMIIPRAYAGFWQALLCLVLAAAGFATALWMDRWGDKIKPKEDEEMTAHP